jgi:hypothetical protein
MIEKIGANIQISIKTTIISTKCQENLVFLDLFKEFVLKNVHGNKSENPGYGN